MVAESRAWYNEGVDVRFDLHAGVYGLDHVLLQPPPRTWDWHQARCDATDAQVWQRCKLFTLEAVSTRMHDKPLAHALERLEGVDRHSMYADLQEVVDGTGRGALALMKKQCESLGMPIWTEDPSPDVQGYTFTTDAGPDVAKARRLAKCEANYHCHIH